MLVPLHHTPRGTGPGHQLWRCLQQGSVCWGPWDVLLTAGTSAWPETFVGLHAASDRVAHPLLRLNGSWAQLQPCAGHHFPHNRGSLYLLLAK